MGCHRHNTPQHPISWNSCKPDIVSRTVVVPQSPSSIALVTGLVMALVMALQLGSLSFLPCRTFWSWMVDLGLAFDFVFFCVCFHPLQILWILFSFLSCGRRLVVQSWIACHWLWWCHLRRVGVGSWIIPKSREGWIPLESISRHQTYSQP